MVEKKGEGGGERITEVKEVARTIWQGFHLQHFSDPTFITA